MAPVPDEVVESIRPAAVTAVPLDIVTMPEETVLPPELVQMIVAKMPYPYIFKARVLSQAWHLKFQLKSQLERMVPSDFQNAVTALSGKWPSYCPLFFTTAKEIVSFDRFLSRWKPVVEFSHIGLGSWQCLSCVGSLLCLMSCSRTPDKPNNDFMVLVSNLLDKSTRILQRSVHDLDTKVTKISPISFHNEPQHVRLVLVGSQAYQVFVIPTYYEWDPLDHDAVLIYDSEDMDWNSILDEGVPAENLQLGYFFKYAVHVDGKFYGMGQHPQNSLHLWRFEVENKIWTHILDLPAPTCGEHGLAGLVFCGDRFLLCLGLASESSRRDARTKFWPEFISGSHFYVSPNSIRIFELDLGSLQLTEVSAGPPEIVKSLCGLEIESCRSTQPETFEDQVHISSDSDFIYFSRDTPYRGHVLTFDTRRLQWGCLPTTGSSYAASYVGQQNNRGTCSFMPGLNPFQIP